MAESREPLLIMCPNKRFQLMSLQPEQIYITYSNKSDRPEHRSVGLAVPATGQESKHTCMHTLTHTNLHWLFDQIDYLH